ncbi:MAG: helix-turn-helix domain-containing protein [Desulforegulaceae bacterium]|nr:helix-turn-helix domain-containing protein [Desulforegulaceae bacterium]
MNRKDKALPETAALLVLKKSSGNLGGVRGRKISIENRKNAVFLIKEANASGASLDKVCEILNISVRTFKRWQKEDTVKEDQR